MSYTGSEGEFVSQEAGFMGHYIVDYEPGCQHMPCGCKGRKISHWCVEREVYDECVECGAVWTCGTW